MSDAIVHSVRGMRDILSPESDQYLALGDLIHQVLYQFGYQYIDLPLLEKTLLFKRTIGDETDIVSKEMYTFDDRNKESVTLRPEGTAGVVRAMIENGCLQQNMRLFINGPMFRYERPQKGRYRQFRQISVETFGYTEPTIDIELIQIAHQVFDRLGILDHVKLQINSLGLASERKSYQKDLVDYLNDHYDQLDEDSQKRLATNPLRILDSKNEQVQICLKKAPNLADYLGEVSQQHFDYLKKGLDVLNIPYTVNDKLVRGLDYYSHSVFEWVTQELGAQGTICAGGRYDGLVEQLGGKSTPGAGFAFGIDRILLLHNKINGGFSPQPIDLYVVCQSYDSYFYAMQWIQELHLQFPDLNIVMHNQFQSLKNQFKKADKLGAHHVLLFAEDEIENDCVVLKNLKEGQQETLDKQSLIAKIKSEMMRDV